MKRHVLLAKFKTLRRRARSEFEILEHFVNERYWDPGPFQSRSKQVDVSVGLSDQVPPSIAAAKARARYLSNQRWPRRKFEESSKPLLIRSPRDREDEVEAVLVLREIPSQGADNSSPEMRGPVGREIQVEAESMGEAAEG